MRRFVVLTLAAALASCATPAQRIATALTDYGIPARQAACMGERLQDRLSLAQLKRLNDLARDNRGRGAISVNALADQLNRDGDPKLVAAVVGAGVGCLF